jgi:hypothetical protein
MSSEQINNPVDTVMEDQASPKEEIAQASLLEQKNEKQRGIKSC